MKHRFIALVAAAFVALLSSAAHAVILEATYTGTISQGFDQPGLFGVANKDLAGDAYTARYVFNTALGHHYNDSTQDYVAGGTYTAVDYGPISPFLSATLTIGGVTRSFATPGNGTAFTSATYSEVIETVCDSNCADGNYIRNSQSPTAAPVLITDLMPFTFGPNAGDFALARSGNCGLTDQSPCAWGFFDGSGTVQIALAAPEPAGWAAMLAGLGVLGAGLRARRRDRLAAQ